MATGPQEPFGPITDSTGLTASKARQLADFLEIGAHPAGRLVEVRQSGEISTVVLEVDVDVGQAPKRDIRPSEPLAVCFHSNDRSWPLVLALRESFPKAAPHLNLQPVGELPSLCLSDQPYQEARRSWTPASCIFLIRRWLALTARDELHEQDQALEPFLGESVGRIIVPNCLLEGDGLAVNPLYGYRCQPKLEAGTIPAILRLLTKPLDDSRPPPHVLAAVLTVAPRQHGVIHHKPRNLGELVDLLSSDSFDVVTALTEQLHKWREQRSLHDAHPILLIRIPLTRTPGGPAETTQLWAFMLDTDVKGLGEALGLWVARKDEKSGRIELAHRIGAAESKIESLPVELLNPHITLSRKQAGILSGADDSHRPRICAVGAGALGSQVILNLVRRGMVPKSIIDRDILLPHNLVRHALSEPLGYPKAEVLAYESAQIIDEAPQPTSIVADVVEPRDKASEVAAAFAEAEVILDMSASVAVGRHLAVDVECSARRLSLFLNPTGSDLVLLAKDDQRTTTVDQLETQYYWSAAQSEDMAGHLEPADRTRYGQSCGDISSRISQLTVSVHAGIGATAIEQACARPDPSVTVWRMDQQQGTVTRVDVDVRPMRECVVGSWKAYLKAELIEDLKHARAQKLPNETGGFCSGIATLKGASSMSLVCLIPRRTARNGPRITYVAPEVWQGAWIRSVAARAE